ncbi:hypothetical protein NBRC116598_06550 [Pseudophaeobacter arcticus]|uniref:Uncharacterized protein n=1 Tax=Pseudophaeobacter arcticus TaxID=385492 RepID=A0ABQ0AH59_9RHOB
MPAAIRVMDQSAFLDGPSIVQGLFKSIENKSVLADRQTRQPTMRSQSAVVTQSRMPLSVSACLTHPLKVWGIQPILDAMAAIGPACVS